MAVHRQVSWVCIWATAVLASFPLPTFAQQAEFIPLGNPAGTRSGLPRDISADGSVVVGEIVCEAGGFVAFKWTREGGIEFLSPLEQGCDDSTAYGVSADGRVIAGFDRDGSGVEQAMVWTDGVAETFSPLGGANDDSRIQAISDNGSVFAGAAQVNGVFQATIWNAAGEPTGLGFLEEDSTLSSLIAASANGSVVVGRNRKNSRDEAIRYTAEAGMEGLGDFDTGSGSTRALGVSADGRVVVGHARTDGAFEAFRWTESTGLVGLGALPPDHPESIARAVSGDGRVIVGDAYGAPGNAGEPDNEDVGFVWSPSAGMLRLRDVLIEQGATGFENWGRLEPLVISNDGRWIAGQARNADAESEAWVARIDVESLLGSPINPGLNDAWYNPLTDGQGFFINVFPEVEAMFVGWFTFETDERPGAAPMADLGAPYHRWLTAIGGWSGNVATLDVFKTEGGVFDDPTAVDVSDAESYGTLTIEFHDCSTATLTYDLFAIGEAGEIPIQRIVPDNAVLCDALTEP